MLYSLFTVLYSPTSNLGSKIENSRMLYWKIMATAIQALLFDFDGLILDTETPETDVWKTIYSEHGFDYPVELGAQKIGTWGTAVFDPAAYLHELTKDSLDVEAIKARHHDESTILIERLPARDGVQDYLYAARRRGLRVAVVSSSPRSWVEPHLTRLRLLHRFDRLITGDDVPPGRVKPHPDIYMKALEKLDVRPGEAIAFEDSPPGVAAAHAAGIYVVAVPNPVTALLNFEDAQLVVTSLLNTPLDDLLRLAIR
jgi:HAD superfamily hydrolase (TIGR01509 family)